ncbi:hypothetical protein HDU67_009594 [Dinochytrium kinnereticum]|nr:hypothetical protein HDU67_009594 [Dinochytrium kinnereticum]
MGPKKPTKNSTPATPEDKNAPQNASEQSLDANDDEVQQEDLKGTAAQASKDMAKVAGFLEQVGGVTDELGISKGMAFINKQMQRQKITKAVREKEASRIQVSKEDIELIVNELELSKGNAEKLLRDHNGDLETALNTYISV